MIQTNKYRFGNFSSSEIASLLSVSTDKKSFGKPAHTYINKKNIERKMGIYLKPNILTRPMVWGHFMEYYVFENYLGSDYEPLGDTTFVHPEHSFWVGSPDYRNTTKSIISDCKAYERENFANYADVIMTNDVELLKKEFPSEYWQLISNACITGMKYIQPILFMPYQSELMKVREATEMYDGWIPLHLLRYIYESVDADLNYLPDNGFYPNLVTNIFEAPQADIELLTNKVLEASKLLTPYYTK